jgi:hypothetical protein
MLLQIVSNHLPDDTVSLPRRSQSYEQNVTILLKFSFLNLCYLVFVLKVCKLFDSLFPTYFFPCSAAITTSSSWQHCEHLLYVSY